MLSFQFFKGVDGVENLEIQTLKKSRFTLISIAALVSSIALAWLFLTPFGSVPDEFAYAHYGLYNTNKLVHVLQANQQYSLTEPQVINDIEKPCFAFDANAIGTCQKFPSTELLASNSPRLANYPKPWFYITSWPLLFAHGATGYYLIRLIAAILNLSLIAWGILLWRRQKSGLVWILGFAISPLLIQMLCSYNPNGFEISSSLTLNLLLYGAPSISSKMGRSRIIGVATSSIGLSIAKPLSGIYVALSVGIYVLLNTFAQWRLTRLTEDNPKHIEASRIESNHQKKIYLVIWSILCTSISFFASMPSLAAARKTNISSALSNSHLFLQYIKHSLSYLLEFAGLFGWRDTTTPFALAILWILFFGTSLFLIFFLSSKNLLTVLKISIIFFLIFVYPALLFVQLSHNFNFGYQSRYSGAAFVILPFVAFFQDDPCTHLKKLQFIGLSLLGVDLISGCYVSLRYQYGVHNLATAKLNLYLQGFQSIGWHTPFFAAGVVFGLVSIYLLTFSFLQITKLNNFNLWTQRLSSIALTSCFAVILVLPSGPVFTPDFISQPATHPFGEITSDVALRQSFLSDINNLSRIDILLATYARKNSGLLKVELIEDGNKLVYRKIVSDSSLHDNSFFSIKFTPIKESRKHNFLIVLSSPYGYSGNAVTAWLTSSISPGFIEARIPGTSPPAFLVFNTYAE